MRFDFRGVDLRALMRAEDEGGGEPDDDQLERNSNRKFTPEPLTRRAKAGESVCHYGAMLRLLDRPREGRRKRNLLRDLFRRSSEVVPVVRNGADF
jgi:hypothetical protein